MLTFKNFTYASDNDVFYKRWTIRLIEALTGKYKLWRIYKRYHCQAETDDETFWEAALRLMNITIKYDAEKLKTIPKKGPLVIISNHPYGVLDGLSIGFLASKIRTEYRVLTNSVLCQAEEIENHVLPVDFSPTRQAWETNLESRQKARALLKLGGCLVIFPAGGVSMVQNFKDKKAWDNAWQPFTSSLIQGNKATVLPLYFEGQNSRLFQLASLTSATLRLSLFFREVAIRMGSDLNIRVGDLIPYTEIEDIKGREELCHYLWKKVYKLGGRTNFPEPKPAFRIELPNNKKSQSK